MTLTIPMLTVSEINRRGREHWTKRHRRAKNQRLSTALLLSQHRKALRSLPKPLLVSLVRLAPRKLDPGDNLASSCKSVRDEIAEVLGVNDGDETAIRFTYDQERAKEYAVRITIEGAW